MKKVIDGKLYNTETAKLLGCHSSGDICDSFSYSEERLFRTRSGAYFLHGSGGPLTPYAVFIGSDRSGGEKIISLTPAEARQWAEEHLGADAYSAEFGEPDEAGSDRVPLNVNITASARHRLGLLREKEGKSYGEIISALLESAALD